MPRDIAGTYTLPAGNPVVDGTIIDITWANPTMADIALQLNNMLTRDGLLGPTTVLKLVVGSVGAPGLTFGGDTDSGMYAPAANVVGLVAGGTEYLRITKSSDIILLTGNLEVVASGAGVQTSLSLTGDTSDFTVVHDDSSSTVRLFNSQGNIQVQYSATGRKALFDTDGRLGVCLTDATTTVTGALQSQALATDEVPLSLISSSGLRELNVSFSTPGETIFSSSDSSLSFYSNGNRRLAIDSSGNYLVNGAGAASSSAGNMCLPNGTAPTATPVGGGQLYVLAGALYFKGSSGTNTLVAPA